TAGSVFAAATEGDYEAGDIVIVADCRRASVFRAAAISEHGGGIRLDRTASRRSRHSPSNLSSEQAFTNGAELLRGEARVYYVGRAPGDGSPALFQQRLVTDSATTTSALAPEELVESVETMQVLYGLDEGLDGAVDQYVTADAVVDWDRIVTVRVALAIRSPDPFGTSVDDRVYDVNGTKFDPADDRRARHVFTTTIALRNRLP
ncbi:MAG TPA: PilW family protein, partial [Gammaproteobacteria bacterium]|nr:PilW family protein [Gammaproteobacteria bacterium]